MLEKPYSIKDSLFRIWRIAYISAIVIKIYVKTYDLIEEK